MYRVHEGDTLRIADDDWDLIANHVRRTLTDWIETDAEACYMPGIESVRTAIYNARDKFMDNGGSGIALPFEIHLPAIGDHPAQQYRTLIVTDDGVPVVPRLFSDVERKLFPGPTFSAHGGKAVTFHQPPAPKTVPGVHTRLGIPHRAQFELNLLRGTGEARMHLCQTCDEYCSDATIELDQPTEPEEKP